MERKYYHTALHDCGCSVVGRNPQDTWICELSMGRGEVPGQVDFPLSFRRGGVGLSQPRSLQIPTLNPRRQLSRIKLYTGGWRWHFQQQCTVSLPSTPITCHSLIFLCYIVWLYQVKTPFANSMSCSEDRPWNTGGDGAFQRQKNKKHILRIETIWIEQDKILTIIPCKRIKKKSKYKIWSFL